MIVLGKQYYEKCLIELENASSQEGLLTAWRSFDFAKITWDERDNLNRRFCEIRDKIRGYKNKLDTDFDLADFCRGGDLTEDG